MQTINIGTEINIQDLLQSRMLIQANSGGGKTAICRTIIEETYGKVPFIVFDDAGEYYPLKEKFGDIVIIGGQFADVPISLQAVTMLPKFIISNHLNVIIDISELKTEERDRQNKPTYPRQQYMKRFLDTLIDLPQQYWKPYFIFIEEAHKYCGEQDRQLSAGAIKELMSGGRKKGYCGILITQRIAKLHKDAAAECNNKFVGRTSLDIDMDRSAKELGFTTSSEFTRLSLRDLKPGHFYAYGTSIEPHHVHVVKVKMPETKLVKVGQLLEIKPKKPTQKLLDAMVKLNDLPAEAEKELKNMQQLQQEVNRLKQELHKTSQNSKIVNPQLSEKDSNLIAKLKNDLLLAQQQLKEKEKDILSWKKIAVGRGVILTKIKNLAADDVEIIPAKELTQSVNFSPKSETKTSQNEMSMQVTVPKPQFYVPSSNGSLPPGELKILTACAQYPNGLNRGQITGIVGFKKSSRDAYIARLKLKSLVEQNGDRVVPTEPGLNFLGPDFEKLPTGTALQEYWQSNLPPGEWKILEAAINSYPDIVTREYLTELTGFLKSSRDAYIARLKLKELITTPAAGEVKAAEILFNE